MNTITAPINFAPIDEGGDSFATRQTKRVAIHDVWHGAAARGGETDFSGIVARLNETLAGTNFGPIQCPITPWAEVGPIYNFLNTPDLLMEAVTPAGGVVITATEAYTDTAATVKATPGQSVAALRNAGGGDIIATQATAAMRPAYGVHPAGGLRNQVPNNIGAGATVGVMGSGGALPDGMFTLNISGREIVAGSLENGYIDLRLFGTPTGTVSVFFYGATTIRAATDQTWVASTGLGIVGGDLTNISGITQAIVGRDASGTLIASGSSADIKASLSATVARFAYSRTLTEAGVGRTSHTLQLANTGEPIDITLRIQLTQFEPGSTPSGIQRTSINGLNVVEVPFRQVSYLKPDAVDDFMSLTTAFEPAGAYTLAAAHDLHPAPNTVFNGTKGTIFGNAGTGNNRFHRGSANRLNIYRAPENQRSAVTAEVSGRVVDVARVTGSDDSFFRNGVLSTTFAAEEGTVIGISLNTLFRSGSSYAEGRFYGGAMLPSAITETSRARLQRWLSHISGVDL